jgi:hypothetical protein
MFETYPKGSKHPSSKVGEQDGKDSWNAKRRTSFKNTTVKDTVYNGDVVQTKSCDTGAGKAGGSKQVSAHYPKKGKMQRGTFGSESQIGG